MSTKPVWDWASAAFARSAQGPVTMYGGINDRQMTLTIDVGAGGASIFVGSATRWDDDPSRTVDTATQMKIVEKVKRALEWKGFQVQLLP